VAGVAGSLLGLLPLLLWAVPVNFWVPALAYTAAYVGLAPIRLGLGLLAPLFFLAGMGKFAWTPAGFLQSLEGATLVWGFSLSYRWARLGSRWAVLPLGVAALFFRPEGGTLGLLLWAAVALAFASRSQELERVDRRALFALGVALLVALALAFGAGQLPVLRSLAGGSRPAPVATSIGPARPVPAPASPNRGPGAPSPVSSPARIRIPGWFPGALLALAWLGALWLFLARPRPGGRVASGSSRWELAKVLMVVLGLGFWLLAPLVWPTPFAVRGPGFLLPGRPRVVGPSPTAGVSAPPSAGAERGSPTSRSSPDLGPVIPALAVLLPVLFLVAGGALKGLTRKRVGRGGSLDGRRRLGARGDGATAAEGVRRAYRRFLRAVRPVLPRRPWETPREHARRFSNAYPGLGAMALELVELYEPVRYGGKTGFAQAGRAEILAALLEEGIGDQRVVHEG